MMKFQKLLLYISIIIMILTLMWYSNTRKDDPEDTPPSQATTAPTDAVTQTGWQEIDGTLYYFHTDGTAPEGWTDMDGSTYYFLEGGALATGWLNIEGDRYYLLADGTPASGWTEIDGTRCYFNGDGTPLTGWQEIDGSRYYLNVNGAPLTGAQEIDGETYYFDSDGTFYNGWITIDAQQYYCLGDGSFATGPTVIDGKTYYFSSSGIYVPLVNPWRALPEDHQTNLLPINDGQYVEVVCYEALMQMLSDCEAAGCDPYVCSAYRTQADQEYLYQRKVKYYLNLDYEQEEAEALAATVVAIPGTSEHQLGLAVDIVDADYPYLEDEQADTKAQKWLMEHCWEYGFILRYPEGTTDITGIIWEPWHYRYVGSEIAMEIRDLGVTLEEYLGFTHE